jgi:hypothetical protein
MIDRERMQYIEGVLAGFIVISIAIFFLNLYTINFMEREIDTIKNSVAANLNAIPLGYHEECWQSHPEEKYEIRDYKICGFDVSPSIHPVGIVTSYGDCPKNATLTLYYAYPDKGGKASYSVPPYIYYWNETICDKTILVKNANNGYIFTLEVD